MNLSRCENGHFFDKEKYATCPHCANGNQTDPKDMTEVFSGGDMTMGAGEVTVGGGGGVAPMDDTLPIVNTPANEPTLGVDSGMLDIDTPTVPLESNMNIVDDTPTLPGTPNYDVKNDFYEDDSKTVAFYDNVFAKASNKTSPGGTVVMSSNQVSSPCVGWLVAIGGTHIGTDFRLKVGKNFIGRDTTMDVALTDDKSVSRNRHAIVVYEPKQHMYLVQPGESSSLVYRNDEVVLNPVKLAPYDIITIGEVNLLFMPLCGDKFTWQPLLEEIAKKKSEN